MTLGGWSGLWNVRLRGFGFVGYYEIMGNAGLNTGTRKEYNRVAESLVMVPVVSRKVTDRRQRRKAKLWFETLKRYVSKMEPGGQIRETREDWNRKMEWDLVNHLKRRI